jgi:hypothetical protein
LLEKKRLGAGLDSETKNDNKSTEELRRDLKSLVGKYKDIKIER